MRTAGVHACWNKVLTAQREREREREREGKRGRERDAALSARRSPLAVNTRPPFLLFLAWAGDIGHKVV